MTATRTPERLGDVADSVEVFAPSRIESLLPGDAAEFLTEAAGVSLPRTSGRGGQTSLFLRGSESNFTSVLLDGFKLTYPGGGGYDFSHPLARVGSAPPRCSRAPKARSTARTRRRAW